MALVLKDRVKETTSTVGTGTYTLSGAVAGFQSFGVIGNANTTYYAITDGTDWEVGIGTYTASGTTLSRDTILESSNAGSAVNWPFGVKDIFVTYPAERSVYLNSAGSAVDLLDIGTLGAGTINVTTANITAGTVSTTPTSNTDLVNKLYVDNLVAAGIHFHTPVRVESPINLNATYNNGTAGVGATLTNAGTQAALVIDGVTVSVNDRVLVYQQTTQTQNGIYTVTNVGSGSTNWVLTRATDADSYVIDSPNGLSEGSTVFVQQGATGAGETYTCNTPGTITFGTTNITFVQISSAQIYSAGTGLTLTGTQFSLSNVGTAATYGSASQVPVFTTNAQGQITTVTNTSIAIPGSAITSGTVAIANGGTGASTADNALTNLGATTVGANLFKLTNPGAIRFPRFNADNSVSSLSDTDFRTAIGAGTVTSVSGTGTVNGITLTGTVTSSGNLTLGGVLTGVDLASQVTGTLPVGNGGTGGTTFTANNVLLGNGTSAFQVVAPGSSGNVLTSNGTTWTSAAPSGGTITIDNKTSAYTVISSDNAKVINCTANTFTVSLTAASSLGAGFNCSIWNTGTGVITIDPAGSETIDARSTIVLRAGEGTQIICDGTNWQTGDKKTMRGYAENLPVSNRPTASGSNSLALLGGSAGGIDALGFGLSSSASTNYTVAIGRSAAALGDRAIGLGWIGSASGSDSIAIGDNQSAEINTITMGRYANVTERGRIAINTSTGFGAPNYGAVQMGFMMLIGTTSNATPLILTSTTAAASTNNTLVLTNNSAYHVKISVIGRQEGASGTQTAAYEFTAVVRRASGAGTTTLLNSTKTVLFESTAGWDCNISANTTNGALDVTVTGAASTAIRWAAKIESIEINSYL